MRKTDSHCSATPSQHECVNSNTRMSLQQAYERALCGSVPWESITTSRKDWEQVHTRARTLFGKPQTSAL